MGNFSPDEHDDKSKEVFEGKLHKGYASLSCLAYILAFLLVSFRSGGDNTGLKRRL